MSRARRAFGVAVLTLAATGCLVEPSTHEVWNKSSQIVDIVSIREGRETVITGALRPGLMYPVNMFSNECVDVVLVARVSASGREIARRTGPFCPDDKWVVVDPP